jgi:hypothetical protein
MTKFAKKKMLFREWHRLQEEIAHLQFKLGAPHDLMMFLAEDLEDAAQFVYLGLPDEVPLTFFPGFEVIDQSALPGFLTTLVCREDGFKERYPDIASKRGMLKRRP